MTSIRRLVVLGILLGTFAVQELAQGGATGAISGTVEDSSGAVVPNATVEVISASTSDVIRTDTTNSAGLFTVTLLPAGTYSVQVNAPGMAETTLRDVVVRVTETTRMTATLKARTIVQRVEVTAEVATIKTADATTGESLAGQTIRELPLATRNFQQLLALSAGASSSLNAADQLGRGDVRINVNGGREDNNNYQIDGIGANDPTNIGELTYTPLPSPDAIQEFKVSTSLYDATQGRNGGGNINAILKSGTFDFHFDVFEYFRNTVLNASDFFLNSLGQPRPDIKQNIFGGSFGGPVGPKAKLGFFFVNYQGTRQRSGDSPGTIISTVIPVIPSQRDQNTLVNAFFPTGLPAGVTQLDPVSLKLMQFKSNQFGGAGGGWLIPSLPQTPGLPAGQARLIISRPGKFTDDQFTANWDREFRGGKDRLSERFFFSDTETNEPFGGDSFQLQTGGVPQENNLNFPMKIPVRDRYGSLTETHVFTDRLVNEFRLGVSVIHWIFNTVPIVTAQDLGINRPTNNATSDIYRFQLSAFSIGPYPTQPFGTLSDTLSYVDTMSYVRGKHSFRLGGEYDHTAIRRNTPVADSGFLFFFPGGGLSDFQNLLLGSTGLANAWSGLTNHDYRVPGFSFFGQDDYRATNTLTLNLGFRVEDLGAPYDTLCHMGNINPALANTTGQPFIYPRCIARFNLPGVTGTTSRSTLSNNWATVLEPRVGFAYDLFGHHTTSIRAGYGIYSVREDVGGLDNLVLTPPTVPGVFLGGGPGSLANILAGTIPPVGVLTSKFIPQASIFQGFPGGDTNQFPNFSGNVINFFGPVVPLHWIAPTIQQWNLTVQRSLGKNWVFEIGYVGTKGTHLREVSDTNQATLASPGDPVIIHGTNCDGTKTGATPECAIRQNTFANVNARAPFLGLGPGGYEAFNPDANSHYHGLQVSASHRFSKGLYLQSAYTFSKSMDDTSSSQVAFDSRLNGQTSGRASRGLSDFDRKHRSITSFAYTLPFFAQRKDLVGRALGDWQLSGVLTLQSGVPITPIDSAGGTAFGLSSPNLVTPDFAPGFSCASSLTSGGVESRLNGFINRSAFMNAPVVPNSPDGSTGFGNVPRNCLRGPSQRNFDFSIGKIFRFGERQNLKFATDFFNLTNTPSFANPSVLDINNPNFGTISSVVGTPRLIQFSLRYSY